MDTVIIKNYNTNLNIHPLCDHVPGGVNQSDEQDLEGRG